MLNITAQILTLIITQERKGDWNRIITEGLMEVVKLLFNDRWIVFKLLKEGRKK